MKRVGRELIHRRHGAKPDIHRPPTRSASVGFTHILDSSPVPEQAPLVRVEKRTGTPIDHL